MDLPEETLRAFIEDEWTLTDEGAKSDQVQFTLLDYNTEKSPQAPHVIVKLAGFKRLQPAENTLYEFTFIVSVALWTLSLKDMEGAQALHWKMVEHIKAMFDDNKPSGWQFAYVDTGANAGVAFGTIPDLNLFNLSVKATIGWT